MSGLALCLAVCSFGSPKASIELIFPNLIPFQFEDGDRKRPLAGWARQIEAISCLVVPSIRSGRTWKNHLGTAIRLIAGNTGL
jgi:hypothetical protein